MAESRNAARGVRSTGPTDRTRRSVRKTKLALRLPLPLGEEVTLAMVAEGYSRKRQSHWIEEALTALARYDPDMSQSLVGDRAQGPNRRQMIVVLSEPARQLLTELIIRLRLQVPTIEGVQSLVLRSAMRFRIRNPEYFR